MNTRAETYRILSDCYRVPDEELIKALHGLEDSEAGTYLRDAEVIPVSESLESLKVDHSKLFVGPFKLLAAPYGSVYLEGKRTVMGDSTLDVRSLYRNEGLSIQIHEVPDHVTMELEFMYFLIFKETDATEEGLPEVAAQYRKKQKDFLDAHLSAWVADFTNSAESNAKTGFYRTIAAFTRSFIADDVAHLTA